MSLNSATGLKLAVCLALSILGLGLRTLPVLIGLTAANLALVLLLKPGTAALWRETRRVFFWQTGVIATLYLIRYGPEGLWPGVRISWQLFMAYLPGIVFMQSTPHARIVETLTRLMPYKMAFVLAACLRFMPMVVSEVKSIYEAQILRGARILPRDLLDPRNWRDLVHCLLVPVIVQSLKLAEEISQAARARDFGARDRRTCWPGA